ncbi:MULTISPECIES: hypothetical protein [Streptomyces]|uniref:hypothetical protein n=1 Tax=Streptomyces TaxID=1883 RepID=UPI0033C34E9B
MRKQLAVAIAAFAVLGASQISSAAASRAPERVPVRSTAVKSDNEYWVEPYMRCNEDGTVAFGYNGDPETDWDWYGLYWEEPSAFPDSFYTGMVNYTNPLGWRSWAWSWEKRREDYTPYTRGRFTVVYWAYDYEQRRYWKKRSTGLHDIDCSHGRAA